MSYDTTFRSVRAGIACVLAVLAAGCMSLKPVKDQTRYYILTPAAKGPAASGSAARGRLVVRLQLVEVADYLKGREIAVRSGANEITFATDHDWAEPLDAGVRRVLAEDLRASPGIGQVVTDQPAPAGRPVKTIVLRVLACEGVVGGTSRGFHWV